MEILTGHSLADSIGRLVSVDHGVCEILQRSERELIGVSYEAFTHPEDRVRNAGAISALTMLDGPVTIRKRYVRPDGSAIWTDVQVSRSCGTGSGELIGTLRPVDLKSLARAPEGLWRLARNAQDLVRHRRTELGDDLFSDYGWTILLEIYLAEVEGRIADVASLSKNVQTWPELVRRWIDGLVQKELVEHSNNAVQLTAIGFVKIESLLDRHTGN